MASGTADTAEFAASGDQQKATAQVEVEVAGISDAGNVRPNNMVPNERISALLADGEPSEKTCQRLIDGALAAGGKDNVTVVVARNKVSQCGCRRSTYSRIGVNPSYPASPSGALASRTARQCFISRAAKTSGLFRKLRSRLTE